MPRRDGRGAHRRRARAPREAQAELDRLSDAELAPRLEALYHLAWAETYLELYDDVAIHVERGIAIARAFGKGQLLVPLMLARNFSFEMQGRLAEASELCETALEAARLSASPHELYRALFELGWTLYYAGDLDGAIAAHEESSRVDPRLAGATIPNGGGGPGWGLGVAWFEAGEVERGRKLLLELGAEDVVSTMPVERCYRLGEPDARRARRRERRSGGRLRREAEDDRGATRLAVTGRTRRARASGCAARAVGAARGRPNRSRIGRGGGLGREHGSRQRSRAASRGARSQPPASAREAIAVLREAEQELEACGSVRVRDEMRRELRRLGARAEPRGPATAGDSGVERAHEARARDRGLVTDRMTNREIATELFLSDKTVESHIRNIFHKLGVSSRVEVARAIERDRRDSAASRPA